MIEKNELRSGNLIRCIANLPVGYHPSEQPIAVVSEIKDETIETYEGTHKYKDVAPVVLTER